MPSLNFFCFRKFVFGSLVIGLLWLPAASALAQDNFNMRLENGSVWLDADNANLQLVLQQLADESGFKLWISGKLEARQVSAHIENKSVTQTLRLLLGDIAHALVRDDDSIVTGLYVLPSGEAQASSELPSSGSKDYRIEAIQNALQSSPLSGIVQETLANQLGTINLHTTQHQGQPPILEQSEALQALTEKLKQIGASTPDELPELLQQLKVDINQQSR
ncbi:MAG: hypothetical protein GY875_21445 [Gammaproteobacteria bacterium]|nr:hypothetical protein [Gammaproteobacteria bacterium]